MWTIERLQSYIDDQVEESIHLDYKAADALMKSEHKKKEISKDVSAFANSDGGIIIYGIREYKQETKYLPEEIDPVKRNVFSEETLEQVINNNITPKISGIKITPVTIGEPGDNNVVYVVEIPKSDTAHQANDKRYYKRYNFQSEAMEDWEIKDIINRKNRTDIYLWLEPNLHKDFYERFSKHPDMDIEYEIWIQNFGNKAAEYIDIFLGGHKDDSSKFKDPNPQVFDSSFEIYYNNEISHKVTIDDSEFVVNTKRTPLLPRVSKFFGKVTINSDFLIEGKMLDIIISTEDNRKVIKKTIGELLN